MGVIVITSCSSNLFDGVGVPFVSTFVGTPPASDGVGTFATFNVPVGISLSIDETYALVADTGNSILRKVFISTQEVTTVAGTYSLSGLSDGIGTNSCFYSPWDVCVSPDGNYALITDTGNQRIRHIIISLESVTTLAGSITGSVNGIGSNSKFSSPYGIVISSDNIAFVADSGSRMIRRIVVSSGEVSSLAGAGTSGIVNGVGTNAKFGNLRDISISPDDAFLLVIDSNSIRKVVIVNGDVSSFAGGTSMGNTNGIGSNALFNTPIGISVSSNCDFALIATQGHQIRKLILSTAEVSLVAGSGTIGSTNGIGTNSQFNAPKGICVSRDGTIAIIADTYNYLVRHLVVATADVSNLVGSGVPGDYSDGIGTNMKFNEPYDIDIDSVGAYAYVADNSNNLIRQIVISTMTVTVFAGSPGSTGTSDGFGTNSQFNAPRALAISPTDDYLLVCDANSNRLRKVDIATKAVSQYIGPGVNGVTDGVGTNARLSFPLGVAISHDGLFCLIADFADSLIRKVIISTATVTTFAGSSNIFGSSDGVGTYAEFMSATLITLSPDDSYAIVADEYNNAVRKITIATAVVTTLLFQSSSPSGVAFSPSGNSALIALGYSITLLEISSSVKIQFAGYPTGHSYMDGLGTNALFRRVQGISVAPDASYALIADTENHLIRKMSIASTDPTMLPTYIPSSPSLAPTICPSTFPTSTPTLTPPSACPTLTPTLSPSACPTLTPTPQPSLSFSPTKTPTNPSQKDGSENTSSNTPALIGGIVGGVVGAVAITTVAVIYAAKTKNKISPYSQNVVKPVEP